MYSPYSRYLSFLILKAVRITQLKIYKNMILLNPQVLFSLIKNKYMSTKQNYLKLKQTRGFLQWCQTFNIDNQDNNAFQFDVMRARVQ